MMTALRISAISFENHFRGNIEVKFLDLPANDEELAIFLKKLGISEEFRPYVIIHDKQDSLPGKGWVRIFNVITLDTLISINERTRVIKETGDINRLQEIFEACPSHEHALNIYERGDTDY